MTQTKKTTDKPMHTIQAIIYPNHPGEKRAVYEHWTDIGKKPQVKSFRTGVVIDLSDRPDLLKQIWEGTNPHDIMVDGKRVPNSIISQEIEDDDGGVTVLRKASYYGDTKQDMASRGELSDEEARLYDFVVHTIAKVD